MKKHFKNIKQFADNAISKPGKAEPLSEELQAAERRVEYFRDALQTLSKALGPPSSAAIDKDIQAQAVIKEKRLKKCPEYILGSSMAKFGKCSTVEDASAVEGGALLRPVLAMCGDLQIALANELVEHELAVEQLVSVPIHGYLDSDIPKLKKNLNKLMSDRDAANTKWQSAQNRQNETTARHIDPSKLSSLQDDLDEAGQRVEQAYDQLAADMFQLLSHEPDVAQRILQHAKLQRLYHTHALQVLDDLIPRVEQLISDSPTKPIYGLPLAEHLRITKRKIALPLEICVCALWELGMGEEGLFRVAASASKIRRLKLSFDSNCFVTPLPAEYRDVHLLASVLKSYLRDLPEPLLTFTLYDEWMLAAKLPSEEQRINAVAHILRKLPQENYDNLRYLIKFLSELSKHSHNKMSSHNIAIVMSPNLLWSSDDRDIGNFMNNAGIASCAVDTLVSHADKFFPGDLEIYVTFNQEMLFGNEYLDRNSHVRTHTRNNSSDTNIIIDHQEMKRTASNSSLSDHSSPPQGSPKPVTRRKNKPAPVPPSALTKSMPPQEKSSIEKPPRQSLISGTATVNRSTYKSAKNLNDSDDKKMSQSMNADDFTPSHSRRKSLDFDHGSNVQVLKSSVGTNTVKKDAHQHISKSDISGPVSASFTVKNEASSALIASGHISKNDISASVKNDNIAHINKSDIVVPVNSTFVVKNDGSPGGHISKSDISGPMSGSFGAVKNESGKDSDIIQFTSLPPSTIQSANITHITAQSAVVGKITVTSDNLQQKSNVSYVPVTVQTTPQKPATTQRPVAAPRLSLDYLKSVSPVNKSVLTKHETSPLTKSLNEIDIDGEAIELRRQSREDFSSERGNKPTVPERPPSLRPQSFRMQRQVGGGGAGDTSSSESNSGSTQLERTVMYNVPDKQQVSIIQVKDKEKPPPGHDNMIAEKEKFLGHPPSSSYLVDIDNFNASLQRRQSVGSKPARPPKPDHVKSNERLNLARSNERLNTFKSNERINIINANVNPESVTNPAGVVSNIDANYPSNGTKPSHGRTMSEGSVLDAVSPTDAPLSPRTPTGGGAYIPASPRNPSRPPRPQPPPPPPPSKPKVADSTDL